jgi:hypothetical protein
VLCPAVALYVWKSSLKADKEKGKEQKNNWLLCAWCQRALGSPTGTDAHLFLSVTPEPLCCEQLMLIQGKKSTRACLAAGLAQSDAQTLRAAERCFLGKENLEGFCFTARRSLRGDNLGDGC